VEAVNVKRIWEEEFWVLYITDISDDYGISELLILVLGDEAQVVSLLASRNLVSSFKVFKSRVMLPSREISECKGLEAD